MGGDEQEGVREGRWVRTKMESEVSGHRIPMGYLIECMIVGHMAWG